MDEREFREAVRASLGEVVPSRLIDDRMREAYESLGEMPRAKRAPVTGVLKWIGATAGGLAAAFMLLLGSSAVNPALASSIPVVKNIVAFLQGSQHSDPLVKEGAVGNYVQPVAEQEDAAFQVVETYFDGEVLLLSTRLTLPGALEEYRVLNPDYQFRFSVDGKELKSGFETQAGYHSMTRVSGNTYVGTLSLYSPYAGTGETTLNLPDCFDLTLSVKSLTAANPKLQILDEETHSYRTKTYDVDFIPEPFTCTVKKDESLKQVYPVNETKNGCTLKQVTVTPAWTEVQLSVDTGRFEDVIVLPYGSNGGELENLQYGPYACQRFRTPAKDETGLTVKFFEKQNRYEPIAEFAVPVEGGYYEEIPQNPWDNDVPTVYDPPLPAEADPNMRNWENIRVVELGESFSPQIPGFLPGSVDVTFGNLRYYPSYEDAGIDGKEMNFSENLQKEWEGNREKFTFVLLDMSISAHDVSGTYPVGTGENQEERQGEGAYLPIDFAEPSMVEPEAAGELWSRTYNQGADYCSEHGKGFSDYYNLFLNPNETKTVQVGYMVPTEELKKGNFQIYCISSDLVWSEEDKTTNSVSYSYGGYVLDIPPLP